MLSFGILRYMTWYKRVTKAVNFPWKDFYFSDQACLDQEWQKAKKEVNIKNCDKTFTHPVDVLNEDQVLN